MFGLVNRGILPPTVTDELEKFSSKLQGLWKAEHNEDGSHGVIKADSIVVNGFPMEDVVDVPFNSNTYRTYVEDAFGIYWTVTSTNQNVLRYYCVGRLAFVEFHVRTTTLSGGNVATLYINIPNLKPMKTKGPSGYSSAYQSRVGTFEWFCTDGISLGSGSGAVDISEDSNNGVDILLTKEYSGTTARIFYPATDLEIRGSCTFLLEKNE